MVRMHAWFGEIDQAFDALEMAIEANPHMKSFDLEWTFGPFADILAKDPRWDEILATVAYNQDWYLDAGDR